MDEEVKEEIPGREGKEKSYIAATSGLHTKDYLAYALGDLAGCLCFSTVTTLLQKYYTDILGLSPWFIMIMFICARVWDAINDPMMGRLTDLRKPDKRGRYRVFMLYVAVPLALATVLMFLPWKELAESWPSWAVMLYATITYIGFGMIYTVHQIPYGSLASVVTTDVKERNRLSVFRSAGAALGSVPVLVITMLWAKPVLDDSGQAVVDSSGKAVTQIQYPPIIIGVSIMAVVAAVLLVVAYKGNKERVVYNRDSKSQKGQTGAIVKGLLSNRSFLGVCLSGLLLLAGQMFTQSFYTYLFNDMFGKNWMNMVSMVCQYGPMVVLMFFAGKLARKFGKKEICAVGASISAAANLILMFLLPVVKANPDTGALLFLVFCFLSGFGLSIITLEIWALATDAIDDVEVQTGRRNDGTSYSIFMFFRKLGQVVSAVAVNGALIGMNYVVQGSDVQLTSSQLDAMYYMSTLIPAAMFAGMALILFFLYGLNKKKTEELQVAKEALLAKQAQSNDIKIGA